MSQAATARVLDFQPQDFIPENELVYSDGVPLDSPYQRKQINLTIDLVEQAMAGQGVEDFYVGGNQFVYHSYEQAREVRRQVEEGQLVLFPGTGSVPPASPTGKKSFKGPDVFVVRGVEPRERKMWVSWLEGGRLPDFVFEIQSPSTADADAREKKEFYAEVFKSREYFYWGADDPELGQHQDVLVGLRLGSRGLYEPIRPDARGWYWSEVLGLYVGRWDGVYDKSQDRWVRLYDAQGRLVPTGKEEERRQKEEERRLRKVAEERAEEERRQKEEEHRLRKVAEGQAKEERCQKEEERRQKEEERRRAEAAEAEVARLKKLLASGGS